MQSGIERLGDFLEHARFPVSLRATSVISRVPETDIEIILKGSDFAVHDGMVKRKEDIFKAAAIRVFNAESDIRVLNRIYNLGNIAFICEDGQIADFEREGLTWPKQ